MGKTTLSQIAEMAGVSTATVSRVINHHPYVRDEIRERVRRIIQETGYHPNPAARSLARQCSNIVGLVIPQAVQILFIDPYFPLLIQGITQACNTQEYTPSLYMFHSSQEKEALYPRIMQAHMFDGLIVTASQMDDPFVPQLLENEVPFVLTGKHTDPRVSYVDVDNVGGARSAVQHLLNLGRQRVAIIGGPSNNLAAVERLQGYQEALSGHGVAADPALIVQGDYTEASGYTAMQHLLPHTPDALFVCSDTMALGALRALHDAGVTVPDDIALVGFDDLPTSALTTPPLTTVRQPIQRTGSMAVEMLVDRVKHGSEMPHQVKLPVELIVRASCGAQS